ncbi:MAG TPA: TrkA C-terminal domain-containing protein, partial [Planctomycetaceae bacterium]
FIVPEGSPAAGKDLRELDLRAKTGTTVLAVQRGGRLTTLPPADFRLEERDTIVIAGLPHQVREAEKLLVPAGGSR